MAKKASLKTISSGFASNTQLSSNFEALNDKLENTLSLDGSIPNAMNADLDMNGNDIINAGSVNLQGGQTLESYVDGAAASATAAAQSANSASISENNANTYAQSLAGFIGIFGNSVFDVGAYILATSADDYTKVQNHDTTQNLTVVTQAIRDCFDDALEFIQSGNSRSALIRFPAGTCLVNNELLSDDFQEKWWNQTNLGKQKFLHISGASLNHSSIIQVSSTWPSAVRNSFNGNTRTFGPWANSPSPSCLFPFMANNNNAPAAASLSGLRLKGNGIVGKDPIPLFSVNELDAHHSNLHIVGFNNWGHSIMGSFNSTHSRIHIEGVGAQPVNSGATLGGAAGFPSSQVYFDYNSTNNVITARCKQAFSTYNIGDAVPFFTAAMANKPFVIHSADNNQRPLKLTLGVPHSSGTYTGSYGIDSRITTVSTNGVAGSFFPVQVTTTANNNVVTLSEPILIGSGESDMVGHLVGIPKAGSLNDTELDFFCSRIIAVSNGNNTDGYSTLTLAEPCRFSVIDDLVWSCAHTTARDETLIGLNVWNINDTDMLQCRWEQSGGYNDDVTAGAYQFISQKPGEAVQYISCKIHGANTLRGQFAAEGSVILDCSRGLHWVGVDVTHFSHNGKAAIRAMGAKGLARLTNCAVGSWQVPFDYSPFSLEPQIGYNTNDWSFIEENTEIKNDYYPVFDQKRFKYTSNVSKLDFKKITSSRHETNNVLELDSTDDLNDIILEGIYSWGSNVPSNANLYGQNSILKVYEQSNRIVQEIIDTDNKWRWIRYRLGSTWSAWRLLDTRAVSSGAFADAGNTINTHGKYDGALHRDTTTGKLMVATGESPTSPWQPADGSSLVTPT